MGGDTPHEVTSIRIRNTLDPLRIGNGNIPRRGVTVFPIMTIGRWYSSVMNYIRRQIKEPIFGV